jgi:hypothetical protein
MPYQYKREPLSDDEVNRLINACETFGESLSSGPYLTLACGSLNLPTSKKITSNGRSAGSSFMVREDLTEKRPNAGSSP